MGCVVAANFKDTSMRSSAHRALANDPPFLAASVESFISTKSTSPSLLPCAADGLVIFVEICVVAPVDVEPLGNCF
jgi:hypothetical protein